MGRENHEVGFLGREGGGGFVVCTVSCLWFDVDLY